MSTAVLSPDSPTDSKRPYYRPTTADQRKLLFQVYEQTGDARKACRTAHVGLATLYYWRPRFEEGGYAALEEVRSHAPHTFPKQLPASIREEAIAAKREHPEWGRRRIADEVRKAHDWQPVIGPSEVRRTLIEAGLWPQVSKPPKKVSRALAMPNSPTR
jgi:transposase